ncbi:MAG: tryptophan synthase subunit alpha [Gemmatimonadetes bacterium]|nr:MAG: tryptophan synthase subunit alpha [Gemmatimonadota bacterium]
MRGGGRGGRGAPAGAGRAALIPYLTAGFPTPALSLEALRRVAAAGADFVEVGVPFSDPLADGPTIQRSIQTALDQGMTLPGVLDLIRRAALEVPVIIMTYLNPVMAFGLERFVGEAAAAGASGLLLTDLPAGADQTVESLVAASPLALIRLIAPTTTPERLARAVQGAPLPLAVGFGIGTAAQARAAARLADGVVVGSAIIDALGAAGTSGGPGAAERLVRELAAAVHEQGATA